MNAQAALVNAHLAVPGSSEENEYLKSLVPDLVEFSYWIGAKRDFAQPCSASSGWTWVTGEVWDYTDWHTTQPECSNSQQYLVEVRGDYRPGWNDFHPATDIPYAAFEWSVSDCNNNGVI